MDNFRKATLVFLFNKEGQICLPMKLRGFGEGKYNGYGGKVEKDEFVATAAKRELKEESGVDIAVESLSEVAQIEFRFPAKNFGQDVTVFFVRNVEGDPKKTEEMEPHWFNQDEIPYTKMWQDEGVWLPIVLGGKKIKARFTLGDSGEILDQNITTI